MKSAKLMSVGLTISTIAASLGYGTVASGQQAAGYGHGHHCDSYHYVGKAVNGKRLHVDLCSVSPRDQQRIDFTYYLGRERIHAQANCTERTWIVYPERITYKPGSQGTANMMRKVCNQNGPSIQTVD